MEDNTDYVKERIDSIHQTELKLVSFLSNMAQLVDTVHDSHVNMISDDNNNKSITESDKVKQLIGNCYEDLSFASVHIRRELKYLELKLPLPPNLSKKASDLNNEKLKQLINDI
ncbi:hypothetical protein C6P42_002787 [Pichia californica]|nr:hypothetical protein C6P42_002787 [[Candida] californica]